METKNTDAPATSTSAGAGEPVVKESVSERYARLWDEYHPLPDDKQPVAVVDESDDGLFVEILYGEDGSRLKRGDKLYAAPTPAVTAPAALTVTDVFDLALGALAEYQANWDTGLHQPYAESERIAMECAVEAVRDALNEARVDTLESAQPLAVDNSAKPDLIWAVGRWFAEVADRPLTNVHRRSLDDTWRQVISHLGGDPASLLGPSHDDLLATNPSNSAESKETGEAK
jgi:hypothetical protein